jgi:ubiquinone/menaquinone biosynthesis C-methylase UbiE
VLTRVLHWLVRRPLVYDAAMMAVGARQVERILKQNVSTLELSGSVIDVGGGTGLWKSLFPAECRHMCLDVDPLKLRGFLAKDAHGVAVLADATALPLADASVDTVICAFIAHHLRDAEYQRMLDEAWRVLKQGGVFIFADPLWEPQRWPGRLLWRYDQGHHPRTLLTHREAVLRRFEFRTEERFAVVHAYLLLVGRKGSTAAPV